MNAIDPPPTRVETTCTDCGFTGHAIGLASVLQLAKDHSTYCAGQRARAEHEQRASETSLTHKGAVMSFDAENVFQFHAPKGNQAERYQDIRQGATELAKKIEVLCPPSRETSLALTNLQQAVMWANAAIAINEADRISAPVPA